MIDNINTDNIKITQVFDQQLIKAEELRHEPVSVRMDRLKLLKKWIHTNREKIKSALHKDFKKPKDETDLTEIAATLVELKHTISHLKKWSKPSYVSSNISFLGTKSHVQYEPKGVCLIISPWNYPFLLTLGPFISAVAAGNTAIIKPSELTSNTSKLISEMVNELFDESLAAVFEGGVETSSLLLNLPFNHIFFTGSPAVGKIVMEAAAKHLSSVTLELGGKSPAIVDQTANLTDAARRIAWGKLINNGQTCVAPDYLLVHKSVKEQLIAILISEMEKQFGNSTDNYRTSSNIARIIDTKNYDRLSGLLEEAVLKGGTVIYGGKAVREELYLSPTLIEDLPVDTRLAKEEIFGPILPIITFNDLDEVISEVNGKPKPLAMYIFSKSKANINRLQKTISAGSSAINETILQLSHPNLPFGGVNGSGIGKAHGRYGFIAFSNEKSVLKQKSGMTSISLMIPPYRKSKKYIDLLIKYILK